MLGMVCSKHLPGGLRGCEGAAISVSALSAFRAAVARAVWSKKLSMTITPALSSLIDGPLGAQTPPSLLSGVAFVSLNDIQPAGLRRRIATFDS